MTSKTTPIGPAFIGVSEVESCTVLEDLAQNPQISAWGLKVIHHDSPNASGMDIGCLYNPKYFHPEHVTNHSQNLNFRSYDQMCVVGSLMGQRIGIIICSWPSRLGGIEASAPHRKAAAEVTRQIADSLWRVDPDMGIIIMGCFNDDPADDSVAKVLKAKKSDAVKPHELYNPWWEKADKGIATVVHQEYRNLFDQIVISGNLVGTGENRWSYFRSEVLNFDFLSNDEGEPLRTFSKGQYLNGYSDHFPVSLFLMRYVD